MTIVSLISLDFKMPQGGLALMQNKDSTYNLRTSFIH
jgi:hypothetical protein